MVSGSGERAKGTVPKIPELSSSPIPQMPPFLDRAHPSIEHQPGNVTVLLSGFPVAPSCRAYALLRSQLSGLDSEGVSDYVVLGQGGIPSLFP